MRHILFPVTFAFLFLLACATPKPPQWKPLTPAQVSRPMALDECLALARQNDVHVTQWRARTAAARAELTTARTLPNPTFVASWEDLGVRDAENKSISNATYGFTYPIFFWLTRGLEIASARHKLRSEEEAVRQEQRQLAIEVGSDFFNLLAAERKERATANLLAEAQSAFRLAEESFKLGAVSGHDVDQARTEVRQSEAELYDARRETRAQRLAIAFAMGAARPIPMQVRDEALSIPLVLATATTASLAEPLPESLIERALRADPAYAKARAERLAAEAALQLEYRRIVPLTEAVGGAARKNDPEGMGHNFAFEMPIPIFDWNQGAIRKAKAELLTAQAEEEAARREVAQGLSEAWESFLTAEVRNRAYSEVITKDRARLALDAQDLFASGQINYTDLLQARREWRQADLEAVKAWNERMTAAWKILVLLGDRGASPPPMRKK